MIVFDLRCEQGHAFEGWFDSTDAFDAQKARGLIACPACESPAVTRVPSAKVSVSKGAPRPSPAAQAPASGAPAKGDLAAGLPTELLAKLREIVRSTEDVGPRFPEEARRIHYHEIPQRPIRGRATPEQAAALADEGVEFAPLPPILTRDEH